MGELIGDASTHSGTSFQPATLVDPGEWGHPYMGKESHGILPTRRMQIP